MCREVRKKKEREEGDGANKRRKVRRSLERRAIRRDGFRPCCEKGNIFEGKWGV